MNEMNIESARYFEINGVRESITIVTDGVTMSVPICEGNVYYDEIMRQVAGGTLTIADAE